MMLGPVTRDELAPGDSLRWVLGMQVEREPFDLGAEPALEPRRPLVADVAERSDVVTPDRDHMIRHDRRLPRGEPRRVSREESAIVRGMCRIAVLLALAAVLAACAGSENHATAVVEADGGRVVLTLEIADSPDERARGLMGRTSLAADSGMLFVYDEPASGGFWMKDTLVPLSIAFLDAGGRILRTLDMEPCRADPCPVYDPGVVYRSALEVNRGAFDRLGVRAGDVIEVDRG
jgi:uncharacterized protein